MKQVFLLIFIISSMTTTVAIADDSYDPDSGVLYMPKVNVGNDNYEVTMIHKGNLVFEVTVANIIIELSDFYGQWIGSADLTINSDKTFVEVNIPSVFSYELIGTWEVVNSNKIKLSYTNEADPNREGYLKLTSSSKGLYNPSNEAGDDHEMIKQ